MLPLVLFAVAIEFGRIGWYGPAGIALIAALCTMGEVWGFLAGFCAMRRMRKP